MSSQFDDLLKGRSEEVQALARAAKDVLLKAMPGATEVVWPKQSIASYGIGPKKMSEHFCYVGLFKDRINLGFYYGADLDDPKGLLEGTGKALRHIKISDPSQLKSPALKSLVKAASKHLPKLKK